MTAYEIDLDQIKAGAIRTYRCPRGCLIGYTARVRLGGKLVTVFAARAGKSWEATTDPFEPLYVRCRHVLGALPVSDKPAQSKRGVVTLAQDDVRVIPPGSRGKRLEE